MVEFRLFYPIDRVLFETKWANKSNSIEKRIDSYLILSASTNMNDNLHIEYGLKLRRGKKLELKIREKRWSDGQEYWLKTIHAHQSVQFNDIKTIVKQLKKHNEIRLAERLVSSPPILVCHVHKFRQQLRVNGGCSGELTGLYLEFVQLENGRLLSDELFFETVSIEKSGVKPIDETIIQQFSQQQTQINPLKPMGYPEFLFQLSQERNYFVCDSNSN